MRNDFQIVNPTQFKGWNDLLQPHDSRSFFHTAEWARTLTESYNYTPQYFSLLENERLIALLPVMQIKSILTGVRGVSLPFTDYCEPLLSEGVALESLLQEAKQYGKQVNWKSLELRGGALQPESGSLPSSIYYRHTLELTPSAADVFAKFRSSTKRNIKKAAKQDVNVTLTRTPEAMEKFYHLNCITRRRHGLPPQPLSFFRKVFEHIIAAGLGQIALANYHGTTVAAAVFFHFDGEALYKYGASNLEHQALRANNLVMWEGIKWYAENGFRSFCFGKTEPENSGLRQFKNGWGTKESEINYYKFDLKNDRALQNGNQLHGFHNLIFQKMPVPVSRMVGKLLYRHMG